MVTRFQGEAELSLSARLPRSHVLSGRSQVEMKLYGRLCQTKNAVLTCIRQGPIISWQLATLVVLPRQLVTSLALFSTTHETYAHPSNLSSYGLSIL